VIPAESALALEPTFDDAFDFTAPHANVVQLAIAQSFSCSIASRWMRHSK
jgi:hypothetical protein